MDGQEKYVAYVGTYTHGSSIGIHVYDIDIEAGIMTEREVIPVNNASHMTKSYNGKYLYSIADEGVEVLAISPDGSLEPINKVGYDGMRGCYLSTDKSGKFLFVGGYHDGKVTVVHTHRDGRLGSIMDGVFHKGLGSVAERNFRPHVSCVIRLRTTNICAQSITALTRSKSIRSMSGAAGFISSIFCAASSTPAHGSSPSAMTDILPTSTVSSPTKSSSTSTTAPERHRNSKKFRRFLLCVIRRHSAAPAAA